LIDACEVFLVIGEGSNLLVKDEGIDCFVLRYMNTEPEIELEGDCIRVGGGTLLSDLCEFTLARAYTNFVYCAGIPGTVGGAVAGNAGAFGRQLGDELIEAEVLDFDGRIKRLNAEEMEFAYRDSVLKHSEGILVSALFKIEKGVPEEIGRELKEIFSVRADRHPDYRRVPTAGSFFRNIEPSSAASRRQAAGWFLEQAGAGDMRVGGAAVFEKHANMIIKADPSCTAQDVFELARQMESAVREKFGFDLKREVRLIGDWA